MKLGFFGINNGVLAEPDAMTSVTKAAEQAGLDSVWTGEHVVLPDPHTPPSPVPPHYPMMDPTAALAFLAAETETIGLATGIIIVPQRNPAVLAKELATVDVLSKGRLIFGIGVGYLKPEFDALGVSFEQKGPRTDEYIAAMRALWLQEKPSFEGKFVSFSNINAFPRPVQDGGPPVVVGGWSKGAYRRALAIGQGWYGYNLDVQGAKDCLTELNGCRQEVSRPDDLGTLEISITPPPGRISSDDLKAFEDLGVDRLIAVAAPSVRKEGTEGYLRFIDQIAQIA